MLFPGGSFLITWPLLFGSLGLAVVCLGTRGADIHPGWLLAASLFAIPALCLLPPAWLMMVWMLMILAAPGVAGLAAALLFNLVPGLALIGRARRLWFVYPAFALAVLALMGTGSALSRPSRDCPEMNSVAYFADWTEARPGG